MTACAQLLLLRIALPGLANPEHDIPCLNGCHCRRTYVAPNSSYSKSWLHAGYEDQLDFFAHSPCLCAEVLARTNMGSFLQHRCVCDRNLHQHSHKEEEACRFEEEGRLSGETAMSQVANDVIALRRWTEPFFGPGLLAKPNKPFHPIHNIC